MDSANDMLPKPSSAVTAERERDAVVVLGMHRTGTSALSGVVHMLGASAPKHLEPGNEFNAKGYWESQPIMRLNDRILHAVGSNWRDWSAFDEGRLEPAARSEFEAELAEVVAAEYGDSHLILLKDPRICRMAPFWLRGLDRAGIVPRIAISIRNPLECAMSLLDRDDIPVREGLLLWLRYVLDAERFTRGRHRCFVPYAELLSDWQSVADKLSMALHVAWPTAPSAASSRIDRFLSRAHRHHQSSYQDLEIRPDVFDWVLATYDAVTKLSAAREPETQYFERLDDIGREFDRASRVFGTLVLQKNAQIDDYSRQLDDRSRQASELEDRLNHAERQLDDEIAASARLRDEAREAVDRLQREGSAALARIAELAAGTKTIEAALAQRTEEAERYRADLEALRAASSAREAELAARALQALAKADELEADHQLTDRELILARIALHKAKQGSRAPSGFAASRILAKFRDRSRRPAGAKDRREAQQAELILASGLFDSAWYLDTYRDVGDAGIDPVTHYLRHGWKEGRNPSARFCGPAYQQRYLDVADAGVNPLVHFLEFGINEQRQFDPVPGALGSNRHGIRQEAEPELRLLADGRLTSEHVKFTHRGDGYEDFDPTILDGAAPDVKVLAFYLPQFHAIPENDEFWGKGFTEWRQIARGLPRFPGHYQPRVPGDLGFYDLTDETAMRRQAELAKAAGIHGFGFYYYWFDGRRVLEQPVERFLTASDIEMPFMLIWANENWTRTWDGLNGEILLRQSYDPKDEAALLADLARHFADPRYIRLGGRPFFIIYQPRHVPKARKTFARWRAHWKAEFGLEPVIFMAQTFGVEDPRVFGLDGAIEFPPHKITRHFAGRPVPDAFSPAFSSRVITYDDVAATSLDEPDPAYPLIKTIVPSWDNDARRPLRGTIIEGSTPQKYQDWLLELARRAKEKPILGESIVAVNAWNEWAEAAYLEPDVYFGSAYLNATARALRPRVRGEIRRSGPRVVLVGHDAYDHGAQRLLLSIGTTLTRCFGVAVHYVLLGDGPLRARYEAIGPCTIVDADAPDQAREAFAALSAQGFALGIANTTVSGKVVEPMKQAGFRIVSLVHELSGLIRSYQLEESVAAIGRTSDVVVFGGKLVHDGFREMGGRLAGPAIVRPQGLYRAEIAPNPAARAAIRAELGLPADSKIVLNVGYGDLRKGFDLFTRTAKELAGHRGDVSFVWVGKVPQGGGEEAENADSDSRRVIAVGHREDVADFYAAADLFFLSSREDPFPSVVLEAMAAGLTVIGFAGATGCEDLIAAHGAIVPLGDISRTALAIDAVLKVPEADRRDAAAGRIDEIRARYDFKDYCFWLLQQLDPALKRVSVLVPNYNHERYLPERLASIFQQSYPVYEVIVLDDASTDRSLQVIDTVVDHSARDITLAANAPNSGSIARQWRSGLERCTGDYVWIAESDDTAAPDLLAQAVRALEQHGAGFCFTDSWQIDGNGERLGNSYIPYVDDIEPGVFRADFAMPGADFLRRFLSVKNVILNMSGVVWRRETLSRALHGAGSEIEDFRLAGDWRLYAEACRLGTTVAYLAQPLNGHRRHRGGVTSSLDKQRHIDEVARLQAWIAETIDLDDGARRRAERHLQDVRCHLELPMNMQAGAEGDHQEDAAAHLSNRGSTDAR